MAIISGIHLLSREKVRKLVIEKWGIAFTEVVRSMDGGDYCTTCLVCFQFQWDCIIFNRTSGLLHHPFEGRMVQVRQGYLQVIVARIAN